MSHVISRKFISSVVIIFNFSSALNAQVVITTNLYCVGRIKENAVGLEFSEFHNDTFKFNCYGDVIFKSDPDSSFYKFMKDSLVYIDSNINQIPVCRDNEGRKCKVDLGVFKNASYMISILYEDAVFIYIGGDELGERFKMELLRSYNKKYSLN